MDVFVLGFFSWLLNRATNVKNNEGAHNNVIMSSYVCDYTSQLFKWLIAVFMFQLKENA